MGSAELLSHRFEHAPERQLIAVDTHLKNVFLDNDEHAAWIDFGFSTYGDPQFVLPNVLSHFAIYALAGHIDRSATADVLHAVMSGFSEGHAVDQAVATRYMALEVLHRWAGKRVVGIDDFDTQQLPVLRFGRAILDGQLDALEAALELLAR